MAISFNTSLQNFQSMSFLNAPIKKTPSEKQPSTVNSSFIASKLISSLDHLDEVLEAIFESVVPHLPTISPWFLSKTVNPRILGIFLSLYNVNYPLSMVAALNQNELKDKLPLSSRIRKLCSNARNFSINTISRLASKAILNATKNINLKQVIINEFYKTKEELKHFINLPKHQKIIGTISALTPLIGALDQFNFLPYSISSRLAIDSLLLTATFLGSGSALISGYRHINKGYKEKFGLKARTSHIVSGVILTALGIASMYYVSSMISKLAKGLPVFYGLDAQQQEGILKHKALHTLSESKTCNAVIIDGASREWGRFPQEDLSFPSSELIYDMCHVRYYRAINPEEVCNQLERASKELGKIDLLAINGHANSAVQEINKNYYLHGTSHEWTCIDKSLAQTAQIALFGCNTATLDNSLAQTGSRILSGKEVIGFASFYNPFIALNSYENGRFKFDSLLPVQETTNGWQFTAPFNSRRFVYGNQI